MAEIRSVSALVDSHERLQRAVTRAREKYQEGIERTVGAVAGAAGGLASGAVRGMGYAKIPRTNIDADLALGAAAMLAAITGMGGKQSEALLAFGIGMAAGSLSRGAEHAVSQWRGA